MLLVELSAKGSGVTCRNRTRGLRRLPPLFYIDVQMVRPCLPGVYIQCTKLGVACPTHELCCLAGTVFSASANQGALYSNNPQQAATNNTPQQASQLQLNQAGLYTTNQSSSVPLPQQQQLLPQGAQNAQPVLIQQGQQGQVFTVAAQVRFCC